MSAVKAPPGRDKRDRAMKVREMRKRLREAGFTMVRQGPTSHEKWKHPKANMPVVLTVGRKDMDRAQVKDLLTVIESVSLAQPMANEQEQGASANGASSSRELIQYLFLPMPFKMAVGPVLLKMMEPDVEHLWATEMIEASELSQIYYENGAPLYPYRKRYGSETIQIDVGTAKEGDPLDCEWSHFYDGPFISDLPRAKEYVAVGDLGFEVIHNTSRIADGTYYYRVRSRVRIGTSKVLITRAHIRADGLEEWSKDWHADRDKMCPEPIIHGGVLFRAVCQQPDGLELDNGVWGWIADKTGAWRGFGTRRGVMKELGATEPRASRRIVRKASAGPRASVPKTPVSPPSHSAAKGSRKRKVRDQSTKSKLYFDKVTLMGRAYEASDDTYYFRVYVKGNGSYAKGLRGTQAQAIEEMKQRGYKLLSLEQSSGQMPKENEVPKGRRDPGHRARIKNEAKVRLTKKMHLDDPVVYYTADGKVDRIDWGNIDLRSRDSLTYNRKTKTRTGTVTAWQLRYRLNESKGYQVIWQRRISMEQALDDVSRIASERGFVANTPRISAPEQARQDAAISTEKKRSSSDSAPPDVQEVKPQQPSVQQEEVVKVAEESNASEPQAQQPQAQQPEVQVPEEKAPEIRTDTTTLTLENGVLEIASRLVRRLDTPEVRFVRGAPLSTTDLVKMALLRLEQMLDEQ